MSTEAWRTDPGVIRYMTREPGSDLITAASAPEYVAARLSIPLYQAVALLAGCPVERIRQGMRSWYLRRELDPWIGQQEAQR